MWSNVFVISNLSFWLKDSPLDQVDEWRKLPKEKRAAIRKEYNEAGIKIIISAFGETPKPTTDEDSAEDVAKALGIFVREHDVDGVDVDYEDLEAFNGGDAEKWLIEFTQTLRKYLPQDKYILTHARKLFSFFYTY